MIAALSIICAFLIMAIIIALVMKRNHMHVYDYDDEVVTHTTVETTYRENIGLNVNGVPVVGMLERQFLEGTPFVIDPVDKDRVFLNTKDDIYEDGAGKWWGLK